MGRIRRTWKPGADGRVVVCDGAMGTMLHSAGAPLDSSLCELNVTRPNLVRDLHAAYLAAGAQLVQTNTFDANRLRLTRFGLEDSVAEINIAGARLAREAVGERAALIAGSVGPAMSASLVRRVPQGERISILREQIAALADWVDVILLETFGDTESLVQAVEVALDECDLPVMAQLTFGEDARTLRGEEPAVAAAALGKLDLAVLGANCTVGPAVLREVVPELTRNCALPVSVQPNAGSPQRLRGRLRYAHNTDYFALAARQFVADGATVVGGCCGTTPAHIRAVANAVDGLSPVHMVRQATVERAVVHVPGPEPLPVGWPFPGRFAVLAGLRAPQGSDLGEFIGLAGRLAAAGADALAITKPDPTAAGVHPIAAGALLGERVRADVLLQVETADRNLPALQADLLGAHALGLRLIVCRTGMPRVAGDYPGIGPPLDVDSVRLVAALSGLNDGADWRGVSTSDRTRFVIGAAVRTSAKDRGHELARAVEKVVAGAHFLLTEVIYDVPAAHSFLTELRGRDASVPVVATLAPFEDVTTILRRTHEDPEVAAPAVLPTGGDDVDRVDQVLEAVATLRDLVVGVLVYLPSGSDDDAVSLIERLRGLP